MWRQPGDVLAVPTDVPVGWLIDARNHVEYGRLAGAIGADEPDNLAGPHLEAKIINRAQAAKTAAYAFEFEQCLGTCGRLSALCRTIYTLLLLAGPLPCGLSPMTATITRTEVLQGNRRS